MALKDLEIRTLQPRDRIYKKADERGLYIEVHPSGSKLWRFKYAYLGKDKRLALGRYLEVTLSEARQKREEARQKLREGVDRKRAKLMAHYKAANTFGAVAREYIQKMIAEGRAASTASKADWLLEQLRPLCGGPLADLKPIEVLAALKRLEAKGKLETARRCRSFAGRVFRYGVATGRAESDPTSLLRGALILPGLRTIPAGALRWLDRLEIGHSLRNDSFAVMLRRLPGVVIRIERRRHARAIADSSVDAMCIRSPRHDRVGHPMLIGSVASGGNSSDSSLQRFCPGKSSSNCDGVRRLVALE